MSDLYFRLCDVIMPAFFYGNVLLYHPPQKTTLVRFELDVNCMLGHKKFGRKHLVHNLSYKFHRNTFITFFSIHFINLLLKSVTWRLHPSVGIGSVRHGLVYSTGRQGRY